MGGLDFSPNENWKERRKWDTALRMATNPNLGRTVDSPSGGILSADTAAKIEAVLAGSDTKSDKKKQIAELAQTDLLSRARKSMQSSGSGFSSMKLAPADPASGGASLLARAR